MTSGQLDPGGGFVDGGGGYADALFGSDGTSEPASVVEEPEPVYADPLADVHSAGTSSMTSSLTAPDAINRVDGPPPLTNEAIVAAGRQLAREQAQQRSDAEAAARQADRSRRAGIDRAHQNDQRRAVENAATRAGQHSQVAQAYRGTAAQMRASNAPAARSAPAARAAPIAQPGSPPGMVAGPLSKADRAALLRQIAGSTGDERRQLMRRLATSRGKSAGKSGGKSWGFAVGFVILILLGTGAGKGIVQAIVDAFNSGR